MLSVTVLILSFISEAYLSDIIAGGDTSVVLGHDAFLSCSLPHASGVRQVEWKRVRAADVQTLATYSEHFKDLVDEQFVGKVTFNGSLSSASIVIKNTTFEDEACYVCSFQVYPTGPKRHTKCLTVKGLSELTASVNPALSSDSDVVISCSVTGKPTPTIQWKSDVQELNFMSNNFTTLNKDSSTTITSNIILPRSQFYGTFVKCLAQSDGMERSEQISIHRQTHQVNSITSRNYIITVSVLIAVAVVVIIIIVICLHTKLKRATFGKKSSYTEPLHAPVEDC